jgi:hypothetical protein
MLIRTPHNPEPCVGLTSDLLFKCGHDVRVFVAYLFCLWLQTFLLCNIVTGVTVLSLKAGEKVEEEW